MRILGIDPGSIATGWGVVERAGSDIAHVAHGTIRLAPRKPLSERLAVLQRELQSAIRTHAPGCAVVERVFVANNARSALVLGQARGAILAALGEAGLPVDELAPREIKKAMTGSGAAEKAQVQAMVTRLLRLPKPPSQDAADALAAALCRAQMGRLASLDTPLRSRRSGVRSRRSLVTTPGPRNPHSPRNPGGGS